MPKWKKTAEERFWEKVSKTETCWLWIGAVSKSGYGNFTKSSSGSRTSRTMIQIGPHRFAYELLVGPIPNDLNIDHLCMNKLCVNPDHLEPVTQKVNAERFSASLTVCPNGHPYTPETTYLTKEGYKECRTCRREAVRRYRERLRSTDRQEVVR